MTVPGGTRTPQEHCNFLRARHTGFSHRVGVSSVYLAPTLRFALRRERGSVGSALPLPLLAGIKAHSLCEEIVHLE